jgi:uncharacterized protein YecE (DUF72 family)
MNTPKNNVLVGTCGFSEAQQKIFQEFSILEIQQTFYQPPKVATAAKWRSTSPNDFIFTLKAWQLITHEATSPTYRRLTEPLSDQSLSQCGDFKWNATTQMAWKRTVEIAAALKAKAVLFQTSRSFIPTKENLQRLRNFFHRIDRHNYRLVFEPRGDAWNDELLKSLVSDLDLVHGVDPFLRKPVGRGLRYFRLHGRPAYHYQYRYTDQELIELQKMLNCNWPNYVLFNNISMAEDARRFLLRLAQY